MTPATPPRSVFIVGSGAQTAVGRTVHAIAAAARARVTAGGRHPFMVDRLGERMVVARAPWLRPELSLERRIVELAGDALDDAIESVSALGGSRVALVIGLPAPRPGLPRGFHERVCSELGRRVTARLPVGAIDAVPLGHVAGLAAVEDGCRRISRGEVDACIAGGVDSYIDRATLEWLDWTGCLHAAENPRGFIPGEAAGFCVLAAEPLVRERSLPVLARVAAAATTQEQKLRRDRAVCTGEGLTAAFRSVLAQLPTDVKVEQLLYDYNGQPHRAEEYGFAVMRVGDRFREPGRLTTPAESWGDVGAATGPLLAMLAIVAASKGYARGGHALVWTSAMVAERTAALLNISPAA